MGSVNFSAEFFVNEGNTAKVSEAPPHLSGNFNTRASRTVLKEFKELSGDGVSTLPDFDNEVAVLKMLEKYQGQLPFKIPRVFSAGKNENAAAGAPVAFIEMTRLPHSLSDADMQAATPEMKQAHAREAGIALAKLHALPLTAEDKAQIKCSPMQFNLDWLEKHGKTPEARQQVRGLTEDLKAMAGKPVFIHNDFHHKNLFARSYGGAISGVCDFCCSGLGPREMDFYPFLGDKAVEKSFLDSYRKESAAMGDKNAVDMNNVATVRKLMTFIIGVHKAASAPKAPKAS